MKLVIFIILSCFFIDKQLTCEDFKKGTFDLPSANNSVHRIIRKSNKQIEIAEKDDMRSEFDIKWLDECTYILYNGRITTKGKRNMSQYYKDTLYNQISNISGNMCTVTSWFTGAKKLESKMFKIK